MEGCVPRLFGCDVLEQLLGDWGEKEGGVEVTHRGITDPGL